jgi:hyaluronoglucosaminidase
MIGAPSALVVSRSPLLRTAAVGLAFFFVAALSGCSSSTASPPVPASVTAHPTPTPTPAGGPRYPTPAPVNTRSSAAGCPDGTSTLPGATCPPALPPQIVPSPKSVDYGETVGVAELVCVDCPTGNLRDLVTEVAHDAGLPMATSPTAGRPQAQLTLKLDAADLPAQGYRLAIKARSEGGADVTIRAKDEAGGYYGLLSMAQLIVADSGTAHIRLATVEDNPSFLRRGVILTADPLDRVRFGVKYKLNFLYKRIQPNEPGVADVIAYCRSHYVTFMSLVGYRDYLTATPRADIEAVLKSQYDLGIRSFSLNFDDIWSNDPAALAASQAEAFNDFYAYLRSLDPAIEVAITTGAYTGVPDRLSAGARTYLTIMKSKLPADVMVFWTGDGIFSNRIVTAGARAYSEFVGHKIGLWDNDGIRFMGNRLPLSGRDADLPTLISTYMANQADDAAWTGSNGQFALLTELMYTWRPETYDPSAARDLAEGLLRAGGWPGPGPTRPTLPPASPLSLPSPS